MRFALICTDKADHLEVRKANRDAHLDHIRTSGVVEMAGPFLDAAGQMNGSLVILSVEDAPVSELRERTGMTGFVRSSVKVKLRASETLPATSRVPQEASSTLRAISSVACFCWPTACD
mgnify:CR=1 FL=1